VRHVFSIQVQETLPCLRRSPEGYTSCVWCWQLLDVWQYRLRDNIGRPEPQIQTPPIRIPPPNINIKVSENFRQWQRTREEMAKNASYHTRDVPKGPDPSESSRTFGRGVNGYFIVVMIAAGIGGFILAVHLYMRCRRPLSPEELALTDPWVRAQMQETAAANASARPPEPG